MLRVQEMHIEKAEKPACFPCFAQSQDAKAGKYCMPKVF